MAMPTARMMAACTIDSSSEASTCAATKTLTFSGVDCMRMSMRFSRYTAMVVASPMMEKLITPHTARPGSRKSM